MSGTCKLCFYARALLNRLGELFCITRKPFGNDHDKASLSVFLLLDDIIYRLFLIKRNLGYGNGGSTAGDTRAQSDMSCPSAHDLHDVAAGMRFACIAELVHEVNDRIHSRIEAYCVVGRRNIIINRSGNTDGRYAEE